MSFPPFLFILNIDILSIYGIYSFLLSTFKRYIIIIVNINRYLPGIYNIREGIDKRPNLLRSRVNQSIY
jgi:hypothetical protein